MPRSGHKVQEDPLPLNVGYGSTIKATSTSQLGAAATCHPSMVSTQPVSLSLHPWLQIPSLGAAYWWNVGHVTVRVVRKCGKANIWHLQFLEWMPSKVRDSTNTRKVEKKNENVHLQYSFWVIPKSTHIHLALRMSFKMLSQDKSPPATDCQCLIP